MIQFTFGVHLLIRSDGETELIEVPLIFNTQYTPDRSKVKTKKAKKAGKAVF